MVGFVSSAVSSVHSRRQAVRGTCRRTAVVVRAAGDGEDRTEHDIPDGGRDWNAEWERFKNSGMKPQVSEDDSEEPVKRQQQSARYQKQKAQAAKKAAAAAAKRPRPANMRQQLAQQKGFLNLPPWRVLQKDWRFWVAVIVALSLLTSGLNSLGSSQQVTGGYL